MFDQNLFIQRLLELRKKNKISQAQLGEQISVSKQAINEIEKGRVTTTIEKLVLLADYFNVSVDFLIGRSDNNQQATEKITLSQEEELMLNNFRNLDDISKGRLIERSKILLESSTKESEKKEAN